MIASWATILLKKETKTIQHWRELIVIIVRSLNGPTFTKLSGDRAAWSLETLLPVGRCRIYRLPPAPDSSSSNPVNTNNSSSNAVNTNNSSRKTVNCKPQQQQSCQTQTTETAILSNNNSSTNTVDTNSSSRNNSKLLSTSTSRSSIAVNTNSNIAAAGFHMISSKKYVEQLWRQTMRAIQDCQLLKPLLLFIWKLTPTILFKLVNKYKSVPGPFVRKI